MLPTSSVQPVRPAPKRFWTAKSARKPTGSTQKAPYATDALLPYAAFRAQKDGPAKPCAPAPQTSSWRSAAMRPVTLTALAVGIGVSAVLLSLMVGLKMVTSGVGAGLAIVMGTAYGVTALVTQLPKLYRTHDGGAYAQSVVLQIMRGVGTAFGFARVPLEGFARMLAWAFA